MPAFGARKNKANQSQSPDFRVSESRAHSRICIGSIDSRTINQLTGANSHEDQYM